LIERLDNVAHERLIPVKAPGGFGKTTLLTQWRKSLIDKGHRVGWINLDDSDNEEAQFLGYWAEALHQANCPARQQLLDAYEHGRPETLDNFLTALVNALADFEHELYLVLDDFHCISNTRIHQLLGRVIKYSPANFHLVVASRAELPPCFAEPRHRNRESELNARSLRFSEGETQEFLHQRMSPLPTAESCRALFDATEGWIAGIQMLAMSNALRAPALTDWKRGLYPLAETILADTLSDLPPDTHDLLLRLAVLDRFNVELCEEVLGVQGARVILEGLAADGLLLVPLDHDDQWYRFHTLFTGHLRERLAKRVVSSLGGLHERAQRWLDGGDSETRSSLSVFLHECRSELNAIDLPSFHYRASLWFERHGLLVEAVQHALASEGEERAYDLIDRCVMSVLAKGELNTILAWTDKIPEHVLARRWRLRVARFWALVLGGLHLQSARQELVELEQAQGIEGGISAFEYEVCKRTFDALNGNSLSTLKLLEQWPLHGDLFYNAVACNSMIYALATVSQFEDVLNILVNNPEPLPGATRGLTYGYRQAIIGWIHFLKGQLGKASSGLCEAQQRLDENVGRYSAPACVVAGFLAETLYESNQLETLRSVLSGRLEMMNERVFFESYLRFLIAAARLQHLQGDDDGAHELLERLRAFGQGVGLERPVASALAERIRLLLLVNDLPAAKRLMTQLEQFAPDDESDLSPETLGSAFDTPVLVILSRARCALKEANGQLAFTTLSRLASLTSTQRLDYFVKVRLLECMALHQLGDNEWFPHLVSLLELTSKCQMLRSLCDEGTELQALLLQLVEHPDTDHLKTHLQQVLEGFGQQPFDRPRKDNVQDYKLSSREHDVLSLLVQGMPNKRIALALNVSAETVKWYLKKLFVKLGATDRVHVIDIARREKLVCEKSVA
jgi:LuxR family maltose regulon positive regulatory protein